MVRKLVAVLRGFQTAPGRKRFRHAVFFRVSGALIPIAALYRRTLIRRTRIIAVVGSFGKTTTTQVVYSALGLSGRFPRGWNFGIYLAIEMLHFRPGALHGVLEVGVSRRKIMARCARFIKPDIAIVTTIGSEHYKSLGTLEETRDEKADMVRALPCSGLAVLNGDDPNVMWMRAETRARVITYGFGEACDVRASAVALDIRKGMRFTLHTNGTAVEISSRLIGRHQVYSLLAAVAVAVGEGLPLAEVLPRLQSVPPVPRRLEVMDLDNGVFLLVDTQKSILETIWKSFETLDELPAGRKLVVLGDIEDPQGPQGPLYNAVGARLARIATRVVFIGGEKSYRRVASGARSAGMARELILHAGDSPRRAADLVREDLQAGDIVLIKGRSMQHLDRVAYHLAGRPVPCDVRECELSSLRSGCSECPLLKSTRRQP